MGGAAVGVAFRSSGIQEAGPAAWEGLLEGGLLHPHPQAGLRSWLDTPSALRLPAGGWGGRALAGSSLPPR